MLTASASGLYVFAAQCPTPPILYLRFAGSLAVAAQDSRPSGSLLLSCEASSSSASCRFIPAHIAVGTAIAGCPPHRPGRALISASGSYLGWVAARLAVGRTLAHPWDTRSPALSRVRVRWKSVLLDPQPSLLTLRRRTYRLCSNDSSVLCRSVTPRRRACGPCGLSLRPPTCCRIGLRCLRGLPVLVHEVSRRAVGSSTTPD